MERPIVAPISIVAPLAIACLVVLSVIPVAAARGKLHVPAYVGLAGLSFALGLLLGWFSGIRAVTGTPVGLAISILFFLLMSATVGCVLALFFYRQSRS